MTFLCKTSWKNSIVFSKALTFAVTHLFSNNEINIDIGVDKIKISASSDCPSDPHQTMLLRVLKYRIRF